MNLDGLFGEYEARYRRGEAPDPREYIRRAGDQAEELARRIADFVESAPVPDLTPAARERMSIRPPIAGLDEYDFASLLEKLRTHTGMSRAALSAELAKRLEVTDEIDAVERYYAALEDGLLPPAGLDPRVVDALAAIFDVSHDFLGGVRRAWRWRRVLGGPPTDAGAGAARSGARPGGLRLGTPADELFLADGGDWLRRALEAAHAEDVTPRTKTTASDDAGPARGRERRTLRRRPDLARRAPMRGIRRPLVRVALLASVVTVAALSAMLALVGGSASRAAVDPAPFTPACAGDGERGTGARAGGGGAAERERVVVAGVWEGEERARFAKVLERFEQDTGIEVDFRYETEDIAGTLRFRLERRCPPDVALLPQPGLLVDLARDGHLRPIEFVADEVRENYAPFWRRLGRVDGTLYGVWFKAAHKSTLWYRRSLFERSRLQAPTTWAELKEVAAKLHARGVTPFAVAGREGWTLTDWFENVYLRTAGRDRYRQLAEGTLSWTHPTVESALRRLAEILGESRWLAGGTKGALLTGFGDSVSQVFGKRPAAAMLYEGDFVASNARAAGAAVDQDSEVVDFPAIDRAASEIVVGGDVAVLFTASAAAKKLIRFLASARAAEPWAEAGGFLSPNKRLDEAVYAHPTSRRWARALVEARRVSFDLSDLQRPAFGASPDQGMWKLLSDYLRRPDEVSAIARRLERAAATAARCARRGGARSCRPRLAVGPPEVRAG